MANYSTTAWTSGRKDTLLLAVTALSDQIDTLDTTKAIRAYGISEYGPGRAWEAWLVYDT